MVRRVVSLPSLVLLTISLSLLSMAPPEVSAQDLYGSADQESRGATRFEIPAGWTVYRGQTGLIVPHPQGWEVRERAESVVCVRPIEKIEGKSAGVVQGVGKVEPDLFPGAKAGKSRLVSSRPEVAVASFSYEPRTGNHYRGVALCFKQEGKGVLYAIASGGGGILLSRPPGVERRGRFKALQRHGHQDGSGRHQPGQAGRRTHRGRLHTPFRAPDAGRNEHGPARGGVVQPRRAQPAADNALCPVHRVPHGDVLPSAGRTYPQRPGKGFPGSFHDAGVWFVTAFNSYLAAPSAEPVARAVLAKMVLGLRWNPAWQAQQAQTNARVNEINRQTHEEISGIINRVWEDRSRSQDRSRENWSQAYRGEVRIVDPATGEGFNVPSGSNYYWRVGAGPDIVGTQTSDRPAMPDHWVKEMRISE